MIQLCAYTCFFAYFVLSSPSEGACPQHTKQHPDWSPSKKKATAQFIPTPAIREGTNLYSFV